MQFPALHYTFLRNKDYFYIAISKTQQFKQLYVQDLSNRFPDPAVPCAFNHK